MRFSGVPTWMLTVAVALACTSPEPQGPPAGAHLLWSSDAMSLDNPWPDGRLVDANGRLVMRPDYYSPFLPDAALTAETDTLFQGYGEKLQGLDGYSTFGSLFLRLSDPIDVESAGASSFKLIDLEHERDPIPVRIRPHARLRYLEIQPLLPMVPSTRHALVVGAGLKASGAPLVRSPDYWAHARGDGKSAHSDAAARAGLPQDEVVLALTFRTQSVTGEMLAAVELVKDRLPAFTVSGAGSTGDRPRGVFPRDAFVTLQPRWDEELTAAGMVVIGTYTSVDVRNEDGLLDVAAARAAGNSKLMDVEFILVTPDAAQHPPPWPVVLAQHGFNGSNRFVIDVSSAFNEAGFAVIGIDAIDNGMRGAIVNFFNVNDPRIVRDKFRQTVLDQIQLATLAASDAIDVDGQPGRDFDGTVRYFGHSMGAIIGSIYTAVSPLGSVSVVNAGGGGITRIFESEGLKGSISILTRPALGLTLEDPAYDDALPWLEAVTQALFDAGDPINYGPLLRSPPAYVQRAPRLLLQEGLGDRIVPNAQTEQLADAMALVRATAAINDGAGLNVLWQVDQSEFGVPDEKDPHGNFFWVAGVRRQAAEFFRSDGTVVLDPAGP